MLKFASMFYNRPNHIIKILFCFVLLLLLNKPFHFYVFEMVPFSSFRNVMEFEGFVHCIAKRSVSSS